MPDADLPLQRMEQLLSHDAWLRSLVRNLVTDDSSADDVLQQTWLSALQRPPKDRSNVRGWLATIAHNFALRQRLRDARRRRYERTAAALTPLSSGVEDVVANLEVRERVLHELRQLEEPYRRTLWWRFCERRSTKEIAEAQGITESAVRTRIQRGLDKLRLRLIPAPTNTTGQRSGWLAALIGFLQGGLLVGTGMKITATASTAGVIAMIYWSVTTPTPTPHAPEDAGANLGVATAVSENNAPNKPSAQLDRTLADAANEPTTVPPAAALTEQLSGRVLDATGQPVAGVPIAWTQAARPVSPIATSEADGHFALALPEPVDNESSAALRNALAASNDLVAITSVDNAWITLRGWPQRAPTDSASIVVAPAIALRGRVVDENRQPIKDVDIEIMVSELPRFPETLERHSSFHGTSTSSAADGRFSFASVPGCRDGIIRVRRAGYVSHTETIPEQPTNNHEIVLRRAWSDVLRGIVVDQNGAIVVGAEIRWGNESTHSDHTGRFECVWPARKSPALRMVVVAAGHQPYVRDYGRETWEREGHVMELRVQLGGPPLTITGTVRHADGRPARGFFVALRDAAVLHGRQPAVTAEQLAAGLDGTKPIEACSVADDGRFVVQGLLPREYRLAAWDPDTLLAITTEPIRAGLTGVDIVLPANPIRDILHGRVLSQQGTPLANVTVSLVMQLLSGMGGQARLDHTTRTNSDGRFELANVPRHGACMVGLTGESVIAQYFEVAQFADQNQIELRTDARCRLRLLAGSPSVEAEVILFLDKNDGYLPMWSRTQDGLHPKHGIALDGTQSAEFTISERAHWMVYMAKGKEVHRRKVRLITSELNHIAP